MSWLNTLPSLRSSMSRPSSIKATPTQNNDVDGHRIMNAVSRTDQNRQSPAPYQHLRGETPNDYSQWGAQINDLQARLMQSVKDKDEDIAHLREATEKLQTIHNAMKKDYNMTLHEKQEWEMKANRAQADAQIYKSQLEKEASKTARLEKAIRGHGKEVADLKKKGDDERLAKGQFEQMWQTLKKDVDVWQNLHDEVTLRLENMVQQAEQSWQKTNSDIDFWQNSHREIKQKLENVQQDLAAAKKEAHSWRKSHEEVRLNLERGQQQFEQSLETAKKEVKVWRKVHTDAKLKLEKGHKGYEQLLESQEDLEALRKSHNKVKLELEKEREQREQMQQMKDAEVDRFQKALSAWVATGQRPDGQEEGDGQSVRFDHLDVQDSPDRINKSQDAETGGHNSVGFCGPQKLHPDSPDGFSFTDSGAHGPDSIHFTKSEIDTDGPDSIRFTESEIDTDGPDSICFTESATETDGPDSSASRDQHQHGDVGMGSEVASLQKRVAAQAQQISTQRQQILMQGLQVSSQQQEITLQQEEIVSQQEEITSLRQADKKNHKLDNNWWDEVSTLRPLLQELREEANTLRSFLHQYDWYSVPEIVKELEGLNSIIGHFATLLIMQWEDPDTGMLPSPCIKDLQEQQNQARIMLTPELGESFLSLLGKRVLSGLKDDEDSTLVSLALQGSIVHCIAGVLGDFCFRFPRDANDILDSIYNTMFMKDYRVEVQNSITNMLLQSLTAVRDFLGGDMEADLNIQEDFATEIDNIVMNTMVLLSKIKEQMASANLYVYTLTPDDQYDPESKTDAFDVGGSNTRGHTGRMMCAVEMGLLEVIFENQHKEGEEYAKDSKSILLKAKVMTQESVGHFLC